MHNSSSYIFIHMHMYVHNIHNVQVRSHAQHTRGRTDPVREIHICVAVIRREDVDTKGEKRLHGVRKDR